MHAGRINGGLVGLHRRRIGLGLGGQQATLFMGDDAFAFQTGVALYLHPRILGRRLIVLHLANGFLKVRLERPFVQLKQRLPLTNVLSFLEEDFLDLTIDLRPDLHRLVGFHVADGVDLKWNVSLLDTGHHHGRRWTTPGTAHLLCFVRAPGYQQNSHQQEQHNRQPQSLDGAPHYARPSQA